MLRKLLILFFALPLSGFATETAPLHLKPESSSKIIGAIRNTEVMVLLENQGSWSKVVDVETGMVGWLRLPFNNSLNVPDNTSTH